MLSSYNLCNSTRSLVEVAAMMARLYRKSIELEILIPKKNSCRFGHVYSYKPIM